MNPSSDNLDIIRSEAGLAADVRAMIEQTREAAARTVNAGMTLLYWRVGRRIQVEILKNQRAEYGGEILAALSQELTAEFGKGFSYSALTRMLRFAENFPEASNCCYTVATIGLVPFQGNHPAETRPPARILRRDVPG